MWMIYKPKYPQFWKKLQLLSAHDWGQLRCSKIESYLHDGWLEKNTLYATEDLTVISSLKKYGINRNKENLKKY